MHSNDNHDAYDCAERIAVLLEVAQIGAQCLCLAFCRQPPIAVLVRCWIGYGFG